MANDTEPVLLNILTDVYIDDAINNRDIPEAELDIKSLANSIQTSGGLLQRIQVYRTPIERTTEHPFPYELGSGYRRCAALKQLAEETGDTSWVEEVPAEIRADKGIAQRHYDQLIENLQRKDLNPMEAARAFQLALKDPLAKIGPSELARAIGWPLPTVSNYVATVTHLHPEVQQYVIDGKLNWSSAKELATAVKKFKIEEQEQKQLAIMACGEQHADFMKTLKRKFHDTPASEDEATATDEEVSTGKEGTQRTFNTIRGSLIETKYIPKLLERLGSAKSKEDKLIAETQIDTMKFMLQMQGTKLGAELAPWENELTEKAQEVKLSKDMDAHHTKYVRSLIKFVKEELKKVPSPTLADGVTPNPNRNAPTLPQVFQQCKATLLDSLSKGKEAGLEEGMTIEGFPVKNVEEFMTKLNEEYLASVKKDKENAVKREEARKLKETESKKAAEGTEKKEPEPAGAVA